MSGILYGVGIGPGDPELITVKGLRLLRESRHVFLPATREGHSYAGSIMSAYLDPERQQIVELVCPPYRDRRAIEQRWQDLAATVAGQIDGSSGVFLCEGDPSLYSTFYHLRRGLELRFPEIAIIAIPGVSSIVAAAAAAAMPLAIWDERVALVPAVHDRESLGTLLGQMDTVALLKVGGVLDATLDALQALGFEADTTLVRRAGRPEEQVVRDPEVMRSIGADYFTTLLIRRKEHA